MKANYMTYLFSLQKGKFRGDLLQVFQIIKGFDNLDVTHYIRLDSSDFTHTNGYKLVVKFYLK